MCYTSVYSAVGRYHEFVPVEAGYPRTFTDFLTFRPPNILSNLNAYTLPCPSHPSYKSATFPACGTSIIATINCEQFEGLFVPNSYCASLFGEDQFTYLLRPHYRREDGAFFGAFLQAVSYTL